MSLLGLGRIPASGTDTGAGSEIPRPYLKVHHCPFLPYMGRILPRDKGRSVTGLPIALIKIIAGALNPAESASVQVDTEGDASPRCGGFGIKPLNAGGQIWIKTAFKIKLSFADHNPRYGKRAGAPRSARTIKAAA